MLFKVNFEIRKILFLEHYDYFRKCASGWLEYLKCMVLWPTCFYVSIGMISTERSRILGCSISGMNYMCCVDHGGYINMEELKSLCCVDHGGYINMEKLKFINN